MFFSTRKDYLYQEDQTPLEAAQMRASQSGTFPTDFSYGHSVGEDIGPPGWDPPTGSAHYNSFENGPAHFQQPRGVDVSSMGHLADEPSRGPGVQTPMFFPGIQDHYASNVGMSSRMIDEQEWRSSQSAMQMDCSGTPSGPDAWNSRTPLLSTNYSTPGHSPLWAVQQPGRSSHSWTPEGAFQGPQHASCANVKPGFSPQHNYFQSWGDSREEGTAYNVQQSRPTEGPAVGHELWRGLEHAEPADIMMPKFLSNSSTRPTAAAEELPFTHSIFDEISDVGSSDGDSSAPGHENQEMRTAIPSSLMRIINDREIQPEISYGPDEADVAVPRGLASISPPPASAHLLPHVGQSNMGYSSCGKTAHRIPTPEGSISTGSGLSSSRETSETSYSTSVEAVMNYSTPSPLPTPPPFPSPPPPEALAGRTSLGAAPDLLQGNCSEPLVSLVPMRRPPGVFLPDQSVSLAPCASGDIANLNSDQLRMLLARRERIEQQDAIAKWDSQQLQQMLLQRLQVEAQGAMAPPPLMPSGAQPGFSATDPSAVKERVGVPPAPPVSPQVQGFNAIFGTQHAAHGLHPASTCVGVQGGASWTGLSTTAPPPSHGNALATMPSAHGMPAQCNMTRPTPSQRQVSDDTSRISRGTVGHPHICKLACKFFGTARGCKDGVECPHCHMCPWKRRYRTARGKAEAMNAKKK